jgi:hypothetical protein
MLNVVEQRLLVVSASLKRIEPKYEVEPAWYFAAWSIAVQHDLLGNSLPTADFLRPFFENLSKLYTRIQLLADDELFGPIAKMAPGVEQQQIGSKMKRITEVPLEKELPKRQ